MLGSESSVDDSLNRRPQDALLCMYTLNESPKEQALALQRVLQAIVKGRVLTQLALANTSASCKPAKCMRHTSVLTTSLSLKRQWLWWKMKTSSRASGEVGGGRDEDGAH